MQGCASSVMVLLLPAESPEIDTSTWCVPGLMVCLRCPATDLPSTLTTSAGCTPLIVMRCSASSRAYGSEYCEAIMLPQPPRVAARPVAATAWVSGIRIGAPGGDWEV